jgi:hypothetical protein
MMQLNCGGDYKLQDEWLEKHKGASAIVYDTVTGLPVKAEYVNPIYDAYVLAPAKFFAVVAEIQGERRCVSEADFTTDFTI